MSIIQNALDKARQAIGSTGAAGGSQEPGDASRRDMAGLPERHRRIEIDIDQLRARDELPEAGEELRFADCYREIKRPLIQRALAAGAHADARLILVTSALPAEGKTFTALNLALSIARERDVSVLLIDADVPKAHLSRTFGVQDEPGLLDALSDETIDAESLVLGTDVHGLELLPAGKAIEGAAELIASARMAQICARLTGRFPRRMALLDSAPLLVSSEARALKQIPGQILMVTRAGKTPRQALLDAIALLDKSRLYGLILNEAHFTGGDGYYTHYGYAAYGATERLGSRPEGRRTR
jgi:exopolysaccharide/PEP-CTERM locus tyrosine autokinase